jgi:hypothetical protein
MSLSIHLYTSYVQILDRNYAEISPHTTGEAASSDEYCSYLCERRIRLISTNGLSNKHTNRSRKVEMLREFRMRFMLLNNVQSLDQVGNRWSSSVANLFITSLLSNKLKDFVIGSVLVKFWLLE